MKSIVEYNKNSIGKVNDTLNNKKMTEEPQHGIMNIYNIDNDDHLHIEDKTITQIAFMYSLIVLYLKEFIDFQTVDEKECELRLNSQQIEKIFLKNLEEYPDLKTVYEKQEMEDLSLKDALRPILNSFITPLEDEE